MQIEILSMASFEFLNFKLLVQQIGCSVFIRKEIKDHAAMIMVFYFFIAVVHTGIFKSIESIL